MRLPASSFVASALAAALAVAGCAVGPDYQRPGMDVPLAFKEAPPGWKAAAPADAARGPWWAPFEDPELAGLMQQVDDANQDLRAAEARWRQASALSKQARAALWPTATANVSANRSKGGSSGSSVVSGGGTTVISSGRGASNSVDASVSVDWELDLWGKLRRQVESQDASTAGSRADFANTRLSLQSQVATNYFSLRVADAQVALQNASVAAYETSLQLTRNRYAAGVASRADVAQAETQWLGARTSAADTAINRAQLEHAIAILVGKAPADFSIAPHASDAPLDAVTQGARAALGQTLPPLPQLPAALPSSLLERRPDVASAERQVASANASVGVAQAGLFPSLSLSATGGWRGSSLNDLFTVPNRFWSIGPALAQTLFDAGQQRAVVEQSKARYDELAATYRSTVLGAMRDVEDQLIALSVLEREADLQAQTVRASGESLALTMNQYRAGTVPYLNVVTAQTTDQSARITALNITGRQFAATVQLIVALGGGWSADDSKVSGGWSADDSKVSGGRSADDSKVSGGWRAEDRYARGE